MKQRTCPTSLPRLAVPCLAIVLVAIVSLSARTSSRNKDEPTGSASIEIPQLGSFRIDEPCVHENLAIYLMFLEGPSRPGAGLVTLAEALKTERIRVKETGEVNRLTVENRSDRNVFIQAGDILRGGQQDRMVAHDLVLPPGSERIPLEVFCVEAGRWNRRGLESSGQFSSSFHRASTNRLTLAARHAESQDEVWKAVAQAQDDLTESVRVVVRAERSPTSMELTLNNREIRKAARPYLKSLRACVGGTPGSVGAAVAINGRLERASIFGWSDLFAKSLPKILSAASVEAVAARRDTASIDPPPAAAVGEFLLIPAGVKGTKRKLHGGLEEQRHSYGGVIRFITRDERLGWIHAEVLFEGE
jgi:hypothetical protein